jgi:transmembrane sensor
MTMNPDPVDERLSISEQAAAWRVTLGMHDSRRRPEFWQWLMRSPDHVREALLMGLLNRELQDLDPEGRIGVDDRPSLADGSPTPSEVRPESRSNPKAPRFPRWAVGVVALAACLVLALATVLGIRSAQKERRGFETYTTGIGEQRTLTLVDGSTVVLDAQSRLEVRFSSAERYFRLEGQALFNVAHDPSRPFRVRTQATTIEAMGTEFNVRTDRLTEVAVLDGVVRVYSQKSATSPEGSGTGSVDNRAQLGAGDGVSVDEQGDITERTHVDPASVTAWRQHRLVFNRVPLEDIVREFNRYDPKQRLRVEGHAASLRFGGVFDASDPGPLLLILARNPTLNVERDGEKVTIRDRR